MPSVTSPFFLNEDVNEIMGQPPRWIAQWGSTIVLVAVALVATLTYFVQYPEFFQGKAVISRVSGSEDAEERYIVTIQAAAHRSGKIEKGQPVLVSTNKFPPSEFGELEGRIISEPSEERNGVVTLTAELTHKTRTTRNKMLKLDARTYGTASIVIDRQPLLYKIFPF